MILGNEAYFVHVSYGGRNIKQALEGPFSTRAEADEFAIARHHDGFGASIYRCTFEATATSLALRRAARQAR